MSPTGIVKMGRGLAVAIRDYGEEEEIVIHEIEWLTRAQRTGAIHFDEGYIEEEVYYRRINNLKGRLKEIRRKRAKLMRIYQQAYGVKYGYRPYRRLR